MKMNNQDTLRIAEIKVDLLDPPYTYKLHQFAMPKVQAAVETMKKYNCTAAQVQIMESLIDQINAHATALNDLRNDLRQFAKALNEIASK
ncbi:hypothetical protein GA0116948_11550 [Chitinophaga costaii]|uniref:Uncharacterized protein n=1 Tax=Chitinophaga costaii TaxID=1335309 RepID=A0A1C4FLH9_9BACT|nr:hypothetical protein [Chitinophaga costaii]PUZ29969.1 hypothetical protein DCM91_00345 [Chitinophaga costaii]SCC56752.1 hypothetical protein GA0116948_11550 [Chitinophaga costaii]